MQPKQIPEQPMEIDYQHFDDRFDNMPERIGELDDQIEKRQREYVANNIAKYEPIINVKEIEGLRPNFNKRTPQTAMWFRSWISKERSGRINFYTPNLLKRAHYYHFYVFLAWGFVANVFNGFYYDRYDFEKE